MKRAAAFVDRLNRATAANGGRPPDGVWMDDAERRELLDELIGLPHARVEGDLYGALKTRRPVKVHGVPVGAIEVLPPVPASKSAEEIRKEKYG